MRAFAMFLSPRAVAAIVVFVCIFAIYSLHSVSSRDPTSAFFNPRTGYTPHYSAIRREQAEKFIASYNTTKNNEIVKAGEGRRKLCVGIPSIARKGARYLRGAVGSLLEGLTEEERKQIYFTVFIPHSDPTVHPAYQEHWLEELSDEVLVYDVNEEEMNHIKDMENEAGLFIEKGLFDYSYLVRKCADRQAPYMAIFEDDIVAMDGWFHRTLNAITEAEEKSALRHDSPDFLYLRLFYTEEFLGWNSEDAGSYLFYSLWVFAIGYGVLFYLRSTNPTAQQILTPRVLYICYGIITLAIALFFALGRATVIPLPAGVNYMPKFGCCSQAFVFPTNKALELVNYFGERRVGFVDVITEEYANEKDELRWAITPSVVQHIGRKSSKVDDYGPESKWGLSVAEKIWSFGFERYDKERLRMEHQAVAEKMKKANEGNRRR